MKTYSLDAFGVRAGRFDDCSVALATAMQALAVEGGGVLRLPAGAWHCPAPVVAPGLAAPIVLAGEGAGVSRLVFVDAPGLSLGFVQDGLHQTAGIELSALALVAQGACGRALAIDYGAPAGTNEHHQPAVALRDVRVSSSASGAWAEGIEIADAWNPTLENVFLSGRPVQNWNDLAGTGLRFTRMCVNAHLTNVRANFWATGLAAHAEGAANTEGLFASNCSMVAVKRGVWLRGSPQGAGRISTFTWHGGLIENRVGGVRGGSAAFHLDRVWTALISGAQCITETITANLEHTYGLIAQDCRGVTLAGCDLNAYTHGLATTGECDSIVEAGNLFTNTATPVAFSPGTTRSRRLGPLEG